ncbi:MAG: hypothetical protein H6566_23350 [Lewinellaceae bacterium]|nr:hypothetical protein [Lewinellaceae bacterium]
MQNIPFNLLFFFLSLFPLLASAQKIELERRVPETAIPGLLLESLKDSYKGFKRMRYYEERNEEGRFFEAKFCFQKYRYSVKFDTLGQLVDVERRIPFKSIPEDISARIRQDLGRYFQRYTIRKVQERLVNGKMIGYELELQGKSPEHLGYFEAQYDFLGKRERIRTLERTPNDFIFF